MSPRDKPLVWLHGIVRTPPFSAASRLEAGYLLRRLQRGEKLSLPHSRPMPSIGSRCHELRISDTDKIWRIVYRTDPDSIVIADVTAVPQISGDMDSVLPSAALASRDAGAEPTWKYSRRAVEGSAGFMSGTGLSRTRHRIASVRCRSTAKLWDSNEPMCLRRNLKPHPRKSLMYANPDSGCMTMRASKRKKLTAAGWTVGGTDAFLGLTPEESAYIEMKLALSHTLRQRRTHNKLSQIELARMVHSSQSRIAKMEAGDPSVSIDLIMKSLLALGASPKDVAKAISTGVPCATDRLIRTPE